MTRPEREAYQTGRQCFEAGEVDAALEQFQRLLESCPRFADVHYMMGLLHERKDELEEASHCLERALHINPAYAEAMIALVSIYERRGQFEHSRALAERMESTGAGGVLDSTTRGKLANLQAGLGDAYREAGDLREAVAAYRKALDRCPGFHDIRHRLGVALREAGVPSQAIAEFKRVLRACPTYLESAVQLGLTYFTLGRTREALDAWDEVLRRDPSREDARMYIRLVQGARARSEQRRPEPAARGAATPAELDEKG